MRRDYHTVDTVPIRDTIRTHDDWQSPQQSFIERMMHIPESLQRSQRLLLILAFLAFISLGLPDGLPGVAWPSMHTTFRVPLSSLGSVLIAMSVGFLASSSSSGYLATRIGIGKLLALSSLLVAGGLFGAATAPSWWVLLGYVVLLGAGGGIIDAGLNTYAAAHYTPRQVNWLHAFYGLGAALGPLLMTLIISQRMPWQWGYALVGVCLGTMAVCFWLTRHRWQDAAAALSDTQATSPDEPPLSAGAVLRRPLVWLGILLFFLYTGLEVSAGQWVYTLFTEERGIAPGVAGTWVSIYWGSLTVGRLIFGVVATWLGAHTILRTSMIAVVGGALLLWTAPVPLVSSIGLALMGLMLAPIFPLLIAQTPARLGSAVAAYAIGFQVAGANLGASLVPGCVGLLVDLFSLRVIAPFIVGLALLLLLTHELLLHIPAAHRHHAEVVVGR